MVTLWAGLALVFFVQVLAIEGTAVMSTSQLIRSHESIALNNRMGNQFLVPIEIDGNMYNLQVDTGSADLWIGCEFIHGSECEYGVCQEEEIFLEYGSGSVCMSRRSGDIRLGDIKLTDATYNIGRSKLLKDGSQGIIGLAFYSIASIENPIYPLDTLDSFSLFLSQEEESFLVLNGVDDKRMKTNQLIGFTLPLLQASHWILEMNQFHVDHTQFTMQPCTNQPCSVIIDSGTTFITMPYLQFNQFVFRYLTPYGCRFDSTLGYYICPKETQLPKLSFILGPSSFRFDLQSWDYTLPISRYEFLVQLEPTPHGIYQDTWILGDTFLKVYPTTFHVHEEAITIYCQDGDCSGSLFHEPGSSSKFLAVASIPLFLYLLVRIRS